MHIHRYDESQRYRPGSFLLRCNTSPPLRVAAEWHQLWCRTSTEWGAFLRSSLLRSGTLVRATIVSILTGQDTATVSGLFLGSLPD